MKPSLLAPLSMNDMRRHPSTGKGRTIALSFAYMHASDITQKLEVVNAHDFCFLFQSMREKSLLHCVCYFFRNFFFSYRTYCACAYTLSRWRRRASVQSAGGAARARRKNRPQGNMCVVLLCMWYCFYVCVIAVCKSRMRARSACGDASAKREDGAARVLCERKLAILGLLRCKLEEKRYLTCLCAVCCESKRLVRDYSIAWRAGVWVAN